MVMFEEGAKRRKRARWEFNSRFLQLCWAVSLEAIQPCQEAPGESSTGDGASGGEATV